MTTAAPVSIDPAPVSSTYRYWAFISYSHRDTSWASRLHARLERWPVPRNLVGKQTPVGPIPRRLFPIFRDRDELSGAESLDDVIRAALKQSRYLIVICSTHSARSKYVNEEIRLFKSMGRDSRIIYVVLDGEPGAMAEAAPDRCFPPMARHRVDADGNCSDETVEPVAADARRGKDGHGKALLKVLAPLLHVEFEDLYHRDRRRRRRINAINAMLAAMLVLMAVASYLGGADSGLRIPYSDAIRTGLDRHDCSIFRRVPKASEIRTLTKPLSQDLRAALVKKRQADGWINDLPPGGEPGVSRMSHAQGMAALLKRPDLDRAEFAAAISSLDNLFAPDVVSEKDGVLWGWVTDEGQQEINSFVPLWAAMALCEAIGKVDANSDPALRGRLLRHLEYTQNVLHLYRRDAEPGVWNAFPFQVEPERHSVYAAALALLALTEAHRAKVPWDGSATARDQLARRTASWIISQHRATGRQHGWLNNAFEENASDVFDGLTAQTYCALLDAEQSDMGVTLSDAMHDDIRVYLAGCSQRTMDYAVDVGEFRLGYRHLDGTVRIDKEALRYLWWPWVLRSADLWLRYAEQHGLPMEHRVQVRRTLAHLVIDLGNQQVGKAVQGYSYIISEDLYCVQPLEMK